MTDPRMVLPGTTYLVTRRTVCRQLLLRPDKAGLIQQIFLYCLAYSAERTGISITGYVLLSNHWHAVVHDPDCRISDFMHDVNSLTSKCINKLLGRFESVWSNEKFSSVRLENVDDIIDKVSYVIMNPTAAGLVTSWKKWPSAISGPMAVVEGKQIIKRPPLFFDDDGIMPETVSLEMKLPPMIEDVMTAREFCHLVRNNVKDLQKQQITEFERKGISFLGVDGVFAQNPYDFPKGCDPRAGINPRIACKNTWGRIEILQRLDAFLQAYREAWLAYKSGDHFVVFPVGTYWMVKKLGAVGASPG